MYINIAVGEKTYLIMNMGHIKTYPFQKKNLKIYQFQSI